MVVFTYGATVFTASRDPAMGNYSTIRQWKNPSIRSGGGKIFVYNKSITQDIITLTWKYMDQTDLTNLLAFLVTVGGTGQPFTVVDPRGGYYLCYFWGPAKLLWTPVELSERDFTIELLVVTTYLERILPLATYYLTNASGNYITDASGNRLTVRF
jgi:hypothetical protein